MWSRNTYPGARRRLVLAFDVGTTCSGISYSILDPGSVPKVEGVTQFPGADINTPLSLSKVPSVLFYDQEGNLRAVGAEVLSDNVKDQDKQWVIVEWFKLHLRPKRDEKDEENSIPPLPPNKTFEEVFADYLRYLNRCALRFIEHAHATLWKSLDGRYPIGQGAVYVLSHPNGWEGYQQQCCTKAVCAAGLVPDDMESLSERLHFVTEGEASLHWASESFGSGSSMKKGTGFTVVDAGGGTIDVSSYRRKKKQSEERGIYEEIASPTCYFRGSVFVTVRARAFLRQRLIDSEYYGDLDEILEAFDDTTKLNFRDPLEPQFVKFAGVGDNDAEVGIRFGQLKLKGAVVEQRKLAIKAISHIILVGGFVNNDYLFECVKSALASISVKIHRVDNLPWKKAVANGSVSFYLDHFVRVRLSKVAYGFFGPYPYNPKTTGHKKQYNRPNGSYINESGVTVLSKYFAEMLPKNIRVSAFMETRKGVHARSANNFQTSGKDLIVHIWSYKGRNTRTRFWDGEQENFTKCFDIVVNANCIPVTKEINGEREYHVFRAVVILYFGLPSIKADLSWIEDGTEKRCLAKIVYDMPNNPKLQSRTVSYGSIARDTNNQYTIDTLPS